MMADRGSVNPDDVVRRIAEAGRGVRLGRGVVGKTGQAVIALIALWGVIIWKLSDTMALNLSLIGAGSIITAAFVWWARSTQNFAERNPAQAMLEGAEFIEYKKLEAETKAGLYIEGPAEIDDSKHSERKGV